MPFMDPDRIKFQEEFKKKILPKLNYGDELTDPQLLDFCKSLNIEVEPFKLQQFMRGMEKEIGLSYKKRLKRMRCSQSYLVLEPDYQAQVAIKEGRYKIKSTLKKTSDRLEAVNVDKLTLPQQQELINRVSGINSLLSIIENSSAVSIKKVDRREISLLSETAATSSALQKIKESSN